MVKKLFKSKLGKVVTLTVMALALVVSGKSMVKASTNAVATYFYDFDFIGNYYWDITDIVSKDSDSSVRMRCTYAEIDGSCFEAVVVNIPGAAQSSPTPYRYYLNSQHDMINYVNEGGYTQTRIDAYCVDDVYGEGALFSGWFQPDLY